MYILCKLCEYVNYFLHNLHVFFCICEYIHTCTKNMHIFSHILHILCKICELFTYFSNMHTYVNIIHICMHNCNIKIEIYMRKLDKQSNILKLASLNIFFFHFDLFKMTIFSVCHNNIDISLSMIGFNQK